VGGSHLVKTYGYTKQEILDDGFNIDYEINYLPESSNELELLKSTSILIEMLANYLEKEKPEALLVLGDRYELLPVSYACLMSGTLLFHISGGEVTEGAIDNQIRHAVTKIANLHIVSNMECKKNILSMAEEDWRICVSGEPALDFIHKMPNISKNELFQELNLDAGLDLFLCTFHPDTISKEINPQNISSLFKDILNKYPHAQILATAASSDPGGVEINQELNELNDKLTRFKFIPSLGQRRYYALLNYVVVMIGNTSSGIIEAQSFKVPVINIGDRQQGRAQNVNTLNVAMDLEKIIYEIKNVIDPKFLKDIQGCNNIYGDGHSSERIVSFLKDIMKNKSKKEIFLKKSTF
jgi:GDP/UDP-N,N'-diacetylbacillosamine 2-epimerase (hydrolysing)